VILDYLSSTLGQFGWSSEAERREFLRWLFWDNHKLTSYTATYRFLRVLAKNADPAVVAEFRTRAEASWKILDAHLADRAYVVGDRLSIADISMCGYLFFDDEIGVDWITYPGIRAWLERIKAQPGWAHPYTLMPGHPLPAAN
jgi:glutathione S-transferase